MRSIGRQAAYAASACRERRGDVGYRGRSAFGGKGCGFQSGAMGAVTLYEFVGGSQNRSTRPMAQASVASLVLSRSARVEARIEFFASG